MLSPRHPGRRRGPMSLAGEARIVTAVVVAPPPQGQLGRRTDIIVVLDVARRRLTWVPAIAPAAGQAKGRADLAISTVQTAWRKR
ncbi:hypothetical protein MPL1032_20547 [Mesorhizobium plurifarium]|uniref:Uncharacterized protein n=1 Tax=Mesorhizobium plurifarium TaxID=69974 RepID=A0A0K2VXY4_MESPL|nr:hypothetical protein MPL1032_20547 [Mesorhizobium plurifarium]